MAQFTTPLEPGPGAAATPTPAPGQSAEKKAPPRGMGFAPFLIGLVVVSIPVVYMEQSGKTKEAWLYTWLVVLLIVLAYSNEFSAFFAQLGTLTRGK